MMGEGIGGDRASYLTKGGGCSIMRMKSVKREMQDGKEEGRRRTMPTRHTLQN